MKTVIGKYVTAGVCTKSNDEIIRSALFSYSMQLEHRLKRKNLDENQRKELQDEYERAFSLTERFR